MATHYIDNMSSSPYYFNANNATTSQSNRTYSSSGYSSYPTGGGLAGSYLSSQSNRYENSSPQQYQSVAGFNRNTTQQRYQTPQSPAPQVRASVRIVGSQDQYSLPNNAQPVRISPQQHHFQFDSRQQPGHATGPAVVYQTPGAAQYTHHNVDLWTEGPSQGQDHYAQVKRFILIHSFYTSLVLLGPTCFSSFCFCRFTSTISFSFSSTASRSFTTILQSIDTGYISVSFFFSLPLSVRRYSGMTSVIE